MTGRSRVLAAALCVLPFLAAEVPAQELPRFSCSASVGTGFGLTRPSSVPVVWRVTGHYNVSRRFSVGAGTGVSCYEKTLVPLFADAKFLLMRRRSFTGLEEISSPFGENGLQAHELIIVIMINGVCSLWVAEISI